MLRLLRLTRKIAAIASVNGLILVTRNIDDFKPFLKLKIKNWHKAWTIYSSLVTDKLKTFHTVAIEKAIGHNAMHMGMPAAIIAEGVDSHNRTEDAILNSGSGS